MRFGRFFFISIAAHLVAVTALYFLPAPEIRKTREFITQLVTPEQAKKPEPPPPPPPVIRVPVPTRPAPPRPYRPAMPQRVVPTPDKPVVPGAGKDDGRPLPEGVSPKPGKSTGGGEGGDTELSSKPGYLGSGKARGRQEPSGRERLFDPGVIGETAVKGEGSRKKDDAITFDTKEYRYAGYMRKLKEKIESIWQYPPEARQRKLYGDLKLRFTIKKDGRLGSIELVRTSGYKTLDDAAIRALKEGEPYWPLPDEWGMDSYTILGHFVYTMYGYDIR